MTCPDFKAHRARLEAEIVRTSDVLREVQRLGPGTRDVREAEKQYAAAFGKLARFNKDQGERFRAEIPRDWRRSRPRLSR